MTASGAAAARGARRPASGAVFAFIAALCFVSVGAALLSQHAYGMEPCAWCVLQRLVFLVIGVVALVGFMWRGATGGRTVGAALLLLALAGLASAVWQHFVAARSASCAMTLADRIVSSTTLDTLLPDVFSARANCAEAAVDLLGVPYAFWSAAVFLVVIAAALRVLRRP